MASECGERRATRTAQPAEARLLSVTHPRRVSSFRPKARIKVARVLGALQIVLIMFTSHLRTLCGRQYCRPAHLVRITVPRARKVAPRVDVLAGLPARRLEGFTAGSTVQICSRSSQQGSLYVPEHPSPPPRPSSKSSPSRTSAAMRRSQSFSAGPAWAAATRSRRERPGGRSGRISRPAA